MKQAIKFYDAYAGVAQRLRKEVQGDVLFDAASRGRYATDASIYQIMPIGVVVPRTADDALIAMQIAVEERLPILPRGAGSSQCGQTVGRALVIDHSKNLNRLVELDLEHREAIVEPGLVLDHLNAKLKSHQLWFPIDVSTSAQATLGGMAGNNSCGSRSIVYGNMVDRVKAIDAWLTSNERLRFGDVPTDIASLSGSERIRDLARKTHALWEREKDEIARRFPNVSRRVAGYNLDRLAPSSHNLARLLVGSEGTLAYFERLHLQLAPLPRYRVLGVCHFSRFYDAMASAQHIVRLQPSAVELVDRTMLDLARQIEPFQRTVHGFLRGEPDCVLLVEFSGDEANKLGQHLRLLKELMHDLGFPESVVDIVDPAQQKSVWDVRKAGLNIMMSMKGDGKPISFIEDCAVPLEHLADYTAQLTEVFHRYGTEGTWYAHASVGCLHVRPILNMKTDGAKKMRAIAEEAAQLVQRYKGAYSGEHGDGIVRSEWIAPFFGPRLTRALEEIKSWFDPLGLMNPGKIINSPKQDDRSLFRFPPHYKTQPIASALDWSRFHADDGAALAGAVEMCNNNGHCRKFDAGTMCPSYRATGDEQHLTRGRANTLRLALSGELPEETLASQSVFDALDLCVSCKGCKRECPTGVDMAKMKIEFLHHYHQRFGFSLQDRLIGYLPHYAALASRIPSLFNFGNRLSLLRRAGEKMLGFSAKRALPRWRRDFFRTPASLADDARPDVVLFVDTFNRYFEPENAWAALSVLKAGGLQVNVARAAAGRPLCCGRTFLAKGMVQQARVEAERTLEALTPFVQRRIPVVGLEPSCLLTFRDEYLALRLGAKADALAEQALLFDEFLLSHANRLRWDATDAPTRRAWLHVHCHQKAFDATNPAVQALSLIPNLSVHLIESSCCGMAGSFGYEASHYDVSLKMAELSLLPAVRKAKPNDIIVASGTSCRQQIRDGANREALHSARVMADALAVA